MRTELASALGFYSPTFFRIILSTDDEINSIGTLTDENAAAFLHEYIHFLQDLTTTYGLMNISYIVDFIKTVNANQRGGADRQMHLPYILTAEKDNKVYYNAKLVKFYAGSTNNVTDAALVEVAINNEIVQSIGPAGPVDVSIERVRLRLDTGAPPPQDYFLGSDSILESMAYEIELMASGAILPPPPKFPYSAARIVADFIIPGFSDSPLRIIALCDLALMDFNPGRLFYYILTQIREGNLPLNNPLGWYPNVINSAVGPYQGFDTLKDLFSFLSTSAASQLSSYFTSDIFGDNRIWFNFLFTKAAILRRDHPHFMLELAAGGPTKTNPAFQCLYDLLGMPTLTNNDGQASFYVSHLLHDNIKPEMTWAISQIFNIYLNTPRSQINRCGLQGFCRLSCENAGIDDYTDHRCFDAPWERINDTPVCTFVQIWRSWGLAEEIPTFP